MSLNLKNRGMAVAATLAVLVGLSDRASAQIVTNGGFETGDLTGWSLTGNTGNFSVSTTAQFVHSGTHGVSYGQVGSLGFLSQTITTTPGQAYTFEFFQKTLGGTPNEFSASWNGTSILDVVNGPIASTWTDYSFTEVASGTSTVISFGFRQDPSFSAFDDVSVTPSGASVPEPSSIVTSSLVAGVMGLGYCWRRRKRRTAA